MGHSRSRQFHRIQNLLRSLMPARTAFDAHKTWTAIIPAEIMKGASSEPSAARTRALPLLNGNTIAPEK